MLRGVFNFAAGKMPQETLGETPGKTPGKTPELILAALKQDATLTIPELAARIGKSESAVQRAIKKLREEKKLERIGPAKGGSWKVLKEKE